MFELTTLDYAIIWMLVIFFTFPIWYSIGIIIVGLFIFIKTVFQIAGSVAVEEKEAKATPATSTK